MLTHWQCPRPISSHFKQNVPHFTCCKCSAFRRLYTCIMKNKNKLLQYCTRMIRSCALVHTSFLKVMLDWLVTRKWILLQNLLYSSIYLDCSSFTLQPTHALKQWQQSWNSVTQNKLYAIEVRVNIINLLCLPHPDKIIIHRLTLGHTWILTIRGDSPRCSACQIELTVEHILHHCTFFTNARGDFFSVTSTSIGIVFESGLSINN